MPEPIRILHVITRMVRGGAQENTLATVTRIHGGGWDSALVTGPALGPEGSLEPECLTAGVRMIRVPQLVREISPPRDWFALRRLTALFRQERPHLVHTHTSKAGILGRIAARRARVPVVLHTAHGHVFHSYEGRLRSGVFIQVERACAPLAQRLIALTGRELEDHLEVGVGRPGQWSIIHSGIDFAPFEAARGQRQAVREELGVPGDATLLGTVGRLVPVKAPGDLVEVLARLGNRFPRLHLLMVGDGPLRDAVLRQARERRLNVVIHPGAPSPATSGFAAGNRPLAASPPRTPSPTLHVAGLRRDVPRLLAAMDLFLLGSLNEGMGRVLVEAMAMELPCVATRVSGIPDVVEEGVTGLLVPPRDPGAMAAAVAALLEHPERAQEMGRRGRRKAVPDFGIERMIEQLDQLYRELLAAKGIPAPQPASLR